MRPFLCSFLLVVLICCEFSEENLQGPPSKNKNKDREEDKDDIVSKADDLNEYGGLKVVPAPDLSQEKERNKGD